MWACLFANWNELERSSRKRFLLELLNGSTHVLKVSEIQKNIKEEKRSANEQLYSISHNFSQFWEFSQKWKLLEVQIYYCLGNIVDFSSIVEP